MHSTNKVKTNQYQNKIQCNEWEKKKKYELKMSLFLLDVSEWSFYVKKKKRRNQKQKAFNFWWTWWKSR